MNPQDGSSSENAIPRNTNQQGSNSTADGQPQQQDDSPQPQTKQQQSSPQQDSLSQKEPTQQFQQMSISCDAQPRPSHQRFNNNRPNLEKEQQPQQLPLEQDGSEYETSQPNALSESSSSQQADETLISAQTSPTIKQEVPTNMPHLLCPYKGPGTKGKILPPIETNYLKIILENMKENAYHYDVNIEPDKPKKHLSKVFHQFCENNFPDIGIAFDGGRSAFAPMRLNLDAIQREVDFEHPETKSVRRYLVMIKETDDMEIPLKSLLTYDQTRQYDMPRRALQCLEIILKGAYRQAHVTNGIQTGGSFFLPPNNKPPYLGDFFELWLGLFQSTVLGNSPYLNVDVTHKAFPKRYNSLVLLLDDIRKEHERSRDFYVDMKKHLSGMDIIYKTPGQNGAMSVYKFMDLVGRPREESFTDREGRKLTVAEYFEEQNYSIVYPDLPCVKLGNSIKSLTVPMEHCSLSDRQAINKKSSVNQTRALIREAATRTDERKNKIFGLLNEIRHNDSPIIQNFGVQLDMKFVKVSARLLDPPLIHYGDNKTQIVKNGVWRGEGMPFLLPQSANKWAILNANPRTRTNEINDLESALYRVSVPTKLNLAKRAELKKNVNPQSMRTELENAKKSGIQIVFCVIPDAGPVYSQIKKTAELQVGVLTQCIKGGTVFRKRNDGSTISNILLKVNAKLNGTNHRLDNQPFLREKCMLIGADVTHPSADQKYIPSVVGVTASYDPDGFCYNVCWRLQGARIEIIEDFEEIIFEHLEFYKSKNGFLPDKIIYYRDGVSEGQFQQVMGSEKGAMDRACRRIEPDYEKKVKMTIIVVQKRHHTRFFPGDTNIGVGKNKNVPVGTIVDTEITHPQENHFYLVSHQSIQGVAKPTKYCILYDDADHSIDDLQGLSYNLCHLYSRCNRSVSYPAPTYYAHLAAYRGRVYIEMERLNMKDLRSEWQRLAIKDDILKGHPMFFV